MKLVYIKCAKVASSVYWSAVYWNCNVCERFLKILVSSRIWCLQPRATDRKSEHRVVKNPRPGPDPVQTRSRSGPRSSLSLCDWPFLLLMTSTMDGGKKPTRSVPLWVSWMWPFQRPSMCCSITCRGRDGSLRAPGTWYNPRPRIHEWMSEYQVSSRLQSRFRRTEDRIHSLLILTCFIRTRNKHLIPPQKNSHLLTKLQNKTKFELKLIITIGSSSLTFMCC